MGKRAYFISRIFLNILTLFAIITIMFVIFRLIPGNPAAVILDPAFPPETTELILRQLGLDKPMYQQYFLYLKSMILANMGVSFYYKIPVVKILGEKFINSVLLALISLLIAYSGAIILGVLIAWKRGTRLEFWVSFFVLTFRSLPRFWTGIIAIMVFSYYLDWLPHAGIRSIYFEGGGLLETYLSLDFLKHLILPAILSGLYFLALPMLLVRNTMLEVIDEDYIELARAKGLKEKRIMFKHVLSNALLPVVTAASTFVGFAIGGQVVIEYVFSWPGLGREIVISVQRYDYPVAQGAFFFLASIIIIMNFLADIIYGYLDPRIVYK